MTVPIHPPCDTDAFIARLGGDADLARQMARIYVRQADGMLAAVRAAIDASSAEALRRAAHAVKGSAANFDAADTVSAAADLEQIGRGGDLTQADLAFARLENVSARLVAALCAFEGTPGCGS